MKNIKNIILCLAGIASFATSCQSILDEHPKTIYTPDYFTTQAGVEGGLTALYARLRYQNGNAYCFNIMTTGTDEATYAQSADGNFKIADMSGAGLLTPDNSNSGNYWTFTYINTANGIITNAEAVGLDASLIAEARFFRAFEYFNMVQIFGGVPLDLGSGELQFNTSPVRTSVRNTVPEVYTRCIFPDLKEAVTSLPDNPRLTGALTKTAARIVLSKAYLTYAWWLKNPKNIPTYPECDRVDPDGHDAAWYYQQAYDIALEAIANPGPFGLEDYYYKVFLGSNDRNKEQVLYADHTENSEQYNGASLSYGSGGNMDNFASWMLQWNYPNMKITNSEGAQVNPVLRTDNQFLGRPWTRMAPTQEALATFTHKDKDSRFDGTFTYIYRTNWTQGGNTYEWVEGPNGNHIGMGEPFLTFLLEEDSSVDYSVDAGQVVVGKSANYDSYVINPSGVSRMAYPGIWKLGPYRTNTTGTGQPNASATRPYVILKFSELYFIAAEAAVQGASGSKTARELLNVLRARAGKWEYKNNEGVKYEADFSAELTAETPATITIDYLLDEKMRESFGEGYRWYDLVRTQTWKERAGKYTIAGAGKDDHTPVVTTRTIEDYHYLRPIPQSQLNSMKVDDATKKAYQNPGYTTE